MVLPLLAAIAPFAGLIGGAISAVGALMAPAPKPTVQTNSIDLKRLRADAEASGFNPLTIIRGGGLSGYGRSEMSAAPDMRLSSAFQSFGTAVANWSFDPYGAERSRTELRLMEAQIGDFARRGSAPSGMSFRVPKAELTGPTVLNNADGTPFALGPGSPAAEVQNEYGEGVGDLFGWNRWLTDQWKRTFATELNVSWDKNGWKPDPRGTRSKILTGGGF